MSEHTPRRVRIRGNLYHPVIPDGAVRVTRPTRWGNPYRAGQHTRAEAVARYRQYLADRPDLAVRARTELAGHDLACWCPPDQECHADRRRPPDRRQHPEEPQ